MRCIWGWGGFLPREWGEREGCAVTPHCHTYHMVAPAPLPGAVGLRLLLALVGADVLGLLLGWGKGVTQTS